MEIFLIIDDGDPRNYGSSCTRSSDFLTIKEAIAFALAEARERFSFPVRRQDGVHQNAAHRMICYRANGSFAHGAAPNADETFIISRFDSPSSVAVLSSK